jgi:Zn-dependent protease with chaperone function
MLLAADTEADDLARPRLDPGQLLLRLISAVLVLIPLGAVAEAVWLVVTRGRSGGAVLALPLVGVAYIFRPRLGRVRRAIRGCYRLTPQQTPIIHMMVERIAKATGAPRPHLIVLSDEWNASAATLGLRRRRVLRLGMPLIVSLQPQELVALVAHELGHFRYRDSLRGLLTQPALTTFGALSALLRPPPLPSSGAPGPLGLVYLVWVVVGGTLSRLLWLVHLGMNVIDARDQRRCELRADLLALRTAGTEGVLGLVDVLVLTPRCAGLVDGGISSDGPVAMWRRRFDHVRKRDVEELPRLRQLTNREKATLFASHPPPGRRHQFLSRVPFQPPAVVLAESAARRIDAELHPYAEATRREMAELYEM